MKIIKGLVYTDKQYIETLEKQRNCVAAKVDKAIELTEELYKMTKEQDSDNVNLIDRLEIILKTLKGEEND